MYQERVLMSRTICNYFALWIQQDADAARIPRSVTSATQTQLTGIHKKAGENRHRAVMGKCVKYRGAIYRAMQRMGRGRQQDRAADEMQGTFCAQFSAAMP
jgi:hypothetical protein